MDFYKQEEDIKKVNKILLEFTESFKKIKQDLQAIKDKISEADKKGDEGKEEARALEDQKDQLDRDFGDMKKFRDKIKYEIGIKKAIESVCDLDDY